MLENSNQTENVPQQVVNENSNKAKKIKTKKVFKIVAIVLAFLFTFASGYFSKYIFNSREESVTGDLIKIIQNVGYVIDPETGETRTFTESDYAYALINGLLDDYSYYFTKEEYEQRCANMGGTYSDYGFMTYSNVNEIARISGNSPSYYAGLKEGDVIKSICIKGGAELVVTPESKVTEMLKDTVLGDSIVVKVTRKGQFEDRPFTLVKSTYVNSYVTYYDNAVRYSFEFKEGSLKGVSYSDGLSVLDDRTALIKINLFEGGMARELKQTIEYASARSKDRIIFDLRNNGGGYMSVLTDVASMLIYNGGQKSSLIARSVGKNSVEDFNTRKNEYSLEGFDRVAVLANNNTASASESLIGAMLHYGDKFNKDNLVIETNSNGVAKTYGKGIMQTTYMLITGGAFKLTTAKVVWPDGQTCIHGKGIIVTGKNAVPIGEDAIAVALETF
jgi:carboxyl-terminal processing protease